MARRVAAASLAVIISILALPLPEYAGAALNSVTFYENDSLVDATSTYQTASVTANLTLFVDLKTTFSNPGYTFADWTTNANGTGVTFVNGASYDFSSGPMHLYAQWIENSVTFYENTNGSDAIHSSQSSHLNTTLTLFANMSPAFNDPGYAFAGWTTNANGTGTSYANGAGYNFTAGDLSLYAQWTAVPTENLSFNANGATGSVTDLSVLQGSLLTLPGAGSLTYPYHTFLGWNTSGSGSGTAYGAGTSLTLNSDTVLYAQWIVGAPVSVSFNANGAKGAVASMGGPVGSSITVPGVIGLIRPGFTLVKWTTAADGSGSSFVTGSALTLSTTLTLYAQWTGHTPALILGAVGSFAGNTTVLTPTLKAQVQHFSVVIKARKFVVVTLYGFTTNTGLASRNLSISRQRANAVAAYLRSQLKARHVTGVAVKAAGEGVVAGASITANRRVEVFVY